MTDLVDQLTDEETLFDDDTMLDMLEEEPEQACAIVWASAKQLATEAEGMYSDMKDAPDDIKNAYIVSKALDLIVQGMQEIAQEIPGFHDDTGGPVH